jgi:uncharacterized membrane protein YphA (DoxX/SURF4 family)
MKPPRDFSLRRTAVTLLRVALGVFFAIISISKIADPSSFAASVSAYKIITGEFALIAATIVPWLELLCGLCLVFGITVRGSALLILSMLCLFTIAVLMALWRGLDIGCGCYTQDPSAERLGWWKIAENMLFILASLIVYREERRESILKRLLHAQSQPLM